MNEQLSDAFKAVVPEPPPTTGWVAGARRKRRNARLAAGGVAVAAVVALAVPLALNLPSVGDPLVAEPAPTPSASPSVSPTESPSVSPTESPSVSPTESPSVAPTPDPSPTPTDDPTNTTVSQPGLEPASGDAVGSWACYNSDGVSPLEQANTGPTLPTGVKRAFFCADGAAGFGTVGPLDPLITDPDRIVELFNAQPEHVETEECGYEYSTTYRIILDYVDGDKRIITGQQEPCQPLTDGTTVKAGAGFDQKVVELWREQRAQYPAEDTTAATDALTCAPAQYSLIPMTIADVAGGIYCSELLEENPVDKVVLSQDLVGRIAEAAQADGVAGYPAAEPGGERGTLLLTNAWGDIFPMTRFGDEYQYVGDNEMMVWTPAPELAAEMDQAFGR